MSNLREIKPNEQQAWKRAEDRGGEPYPASVVTAEDQMRFEFEEALKNGDRIFLVWHQEEAGLGTRVHYSDFERLAPRTYWSHFLADIQGILTRYFVKLTD
jgi:hypothetical protein